MAVGLHSFVRSFVLSFVRLFARSLVRSLVRRSFVRSSVRPSVRSFFRSFCSLSYDIHNLFQNEFSRMRSKAFFFQFPESSHFFQDHPVAAYIFSPVFLSLLSFVLYSLP